ncbi:MAG: FAD-dependent oxidoreductase [Erysipelotrichaceae bacterium]|nr:FAD-dependent oxidoreductase [Erysipelotrichaceae bacterium]MDY5251909.1 FAD-dependent oxidoreductase [Erysipelotrichaceae bacterium]
MVHQDATRCLKCKNALCQKHCPINTDVPKIIELYNANEIEQAQKLLFANNPFSAVCSLVCDHQRQCFGNCVLNFKQVPIHFYEIEQELSLSYLKNVHFASNTPTKQKIAIVGAGPAGISSAIWLSDEGYDVTLYEANAKIGGVLRYGIPDFRLSKDIVDQYARILKEKGVHIRVNCHIGTSIGLAELASEHDAIILAVGTQQAKMMHIPNETRYNVHYAIDYLKDPSSFELGKKVIVLGGGNVAMDACRMAQKQGYDTYVYYRKTFEDMPANKEEVDQALAEGVKFKMFEVPIAIDDQGMIFAKGENVLDERGRKQTKIIPDTQHHVDCDSVIVAISQTLRLDFPQLKLNKWGFYETLSGHGCEDKKIFVCGDAYLGAKTVVEAVNDAKATVKEVMEHLHG